ncbi:MAG: KilA-N domain-containing protein [Bacteroides sp.]|nr:KilA-N domain-containing protein [Bacteroides sp.]
MEILRFREELVITNVFSSLAEQVKTSRGATGGTWMENTLAKKFAEWLSPEFAIWYKQLVQQLSPEEISLVRTKPKIAPLSYPEPATLEEAKAQLAQLQQQFEENRHKIEFYNDFIEERSWFKTTTIVEELKTTPSQLHRFLVEQQVCKYVNRQYRARLSYLQCEVPYL